MEEPWPKEQIKLLDTFCRILKKKTKGRWQKGLNPGDFDIRIPGPWEGKKFHTLSGRLFEPENIHWDKAFEDKAAQVFRECNERLRESIGRFPGRGD